MLLNYIAQKTILDFVKCSLRLYCTAIYQYDGGEPSWQSSYSSFTLLLCGLKWIVIAV